MSTLQNWIEEHLNPPQREAVETLEGPLLILAGAGSGKTRVVTCRIANLIAHGVRPWQILAITFTNKAAGEMRRRVDDMLAASAAPQEGFDAKPSAVWISTFHSFCARLMRREGSALGYPKDFTIYDENDATDVLKEIVQKLGLTEDKRYTARSVRHQISTLKNKAMGPDDLEDALFHQRTLKEIFKLYEAALKKNGALDFDDLLREAVILFRDHPDILARWQERFRYILIDEYQDTNGCQYHLINQLARKYRNLCATGDPDQSIYGWRGADVRNILSFERDFPDAKIVKLEQNYRSTQRILLAAGAVIDNNVERKKKALWTENAEGEPISLTLTADETQEAAEVARQIASHVREGRRRSDIAVFYRTNAQSRLFEQSMREAGIAYQLIGGTAFYERREVKDALAYLRLLINPKDDVSFQRVINVPRRGLGDSALELIQQQAEKLGCSMLETLDGLEAEAFFTLFKPKPRQNLLQFAKLIDSLRAMPPYPVADIVKKLMLDSGLRNTFETAEELERVQNLEDLVNAAAQYDIRKKPVAASVAEAPPEEPGAMDGLEAEAPPSLADFLQESALLAATDNYDGEQDLVTLMTLHMAKGLEFPVVFLTGMEDGLLPMLRQASPTDADAYREGEDTRAVEEERRLVYVGITRAREKLHLSQARVRMKFGQTNIAIPSRFLNEIPDKLLRVEDCSRALFTSSFRSNFHGGPLPRNETAKSFEEFDREISDDIDEPPVKREEPRHPSRRHDEALKRVVDRMLDRSESQEDPNALESGDRVRHAMFGEGVIETLTGSGLSLKAKVNFRGVGSKVLMVNMAKLEKI